MAPGRAADNQRIIRHIAGDNRTRGDHGPSPYGNSREDSGICADTAALPKDCFEVLRRVLLAPRPHIIREGGARPNEHIVFQNETVPKINTAFQGYPVPNSHLTFDEGMVANVAVIAHHGTFDNVGKRPDPRPVPNTDTGINQSLRMYKTFRH